jgi:hypothetical protein
MAQHSSFSYDVTPELKSHYDAIRQQRGWDWQTLADYFSQQDTDPASEFLEAWAREQVTADKQTRAKAPAKEKRG